MKVVIRALMQCLAAQVKMEMKYRVNFLVGLISQIVFSLLAVAFIGVFLPEGARISGWGFWEIVFLFGIGDVTFGLSAILVFRAFLVFDSVYVIQGELDQLLVQPIHPLVNLILRNLNVNDLVTVVKGVCIVFLASYNLGFTWTIAMFALLLIGVLFGTGTYCGIFIILFSMGFWFPRRSSIVAPLLSLNQLAQYPMFIYPEWLQIILSLLLPLGFVAYYPVETLFFTGAVITEKTMEWWSLLLVPTTVLIIAYMLFSVGLKQYDSAGS